MRYWDSSALVPLCVEEEATAEVMRCLQADRAIATWWGSRVECVSGLMRWVREEELPADAEAEIRGLLTELFGAAFEVLPVEQLRERAERLLAVHPLRAADAVQLAAALVWARERPLGRGFVCLDQRLSTAARKEGFDVVPATRA